ncbi:MAG TPA: class I fructose-bisphosphate aldolase [Burkholderiaceae bacterium]|nr:class I fructose-bisphosphate aldolase [Burkholderiaceae bacterium]
MNDTQLRATAQAMCADGKGLLAMDESNPTCNKRFAALGIEQSATMRRAYRDLLVSAPGLNRSIAGAILSDETIGQQTLAGVPFAHALADAGIVPGIKVDAGTVELAGHAGEKITQGLDGLRERLAGYVQLGARFAKWRAVITIGQAMPGQACIAANAHALARYAVLCQEAGLVPIVEPEVLMDGAHTLARCAQVSEAVLHVLFAQLREQGALLEGLVLKPNMVLPGLACAQQESAAVIAEATLACLRRAVPAAVPAIAFLSGGQSPELASERLAAMHAGNGPLPWALTFSFARAIQQPALALWRGLPANVEPAQRALVHRADCNRAACLGRYSAAMESAGGMQ